MHLGEAIAGKADDLLVVLGMLVALMGVLIGGIMMARPGNPH